MVTIYKNWKWTKGAPLADGRFIAEIHDESGISWYELMVILDKIKSYRWVVGMQPNGYASWATDGHVDSKYLPVDGGDIYVVDDIPEAMKSDIRYWQWDGVKFVKNDPAMTPSERTKEDIMSDLMKLQEELKAL